ncbi:antibiotic biosynthesis monooxygenase [Rubrivirga sp. IMCC45206]|uniref:antibiotic biosynthesis monooxygenase n=1 Tax=Rubrivirga sp. IMCC45206 TaxID=3391614 RepID=UPI00398FDA81
MIVRFWHGWTAPADADAYQAFLAREIADGFLTDPAPGFRGIEVLRRVQGDEVAFVTVMRFADWAAVRAFAGDDPERAVVPTAARELLARFDARATHYEVAEHHP